MIGKKEAAWLVSKLAQMRGYPKGEGAALAELVSALETAASVEIATDCVRTFLDAATHDTPCPMPRDIRNALYDAQRAKTTKRRCEACAGSGLVVVPLLVTYYSGSSMSVKAHEVLRGYQESQIRDFCSKLGSNQTILATTEACECTKPGWSPPSKSVGCYVCDDFGFMGRKDLDDVWRWCDCAMAIQKRQEDPELVNEANAARVKLMAIPKARALLSGQEAPRRVPLATVREYLGGGA